MAGELSLNKLSWEIDALYWGNASFPPTLPWRKGGHRLLGNQPLQLLVLRAALSEWGSCSSHRAGREGGWLREIAVRNTERVLIMLAKYPKGLDALWCPCPGWHWTAQTQYSQSAQSSTYNIPVSYLEFIKHRGNLLLKHTKGFPPPFEVPD